MSRLARWAEWLYRMDRRESFWLAVLGLALVSTLDHATGAELSLATVYLLPIMVVSWGCGMRYGIAFAALSIASQVTLGIVQDHRSARVLYFAASMLNRSMTYLVVALLTAGLRNVHERERRSARLDHLTGVSNRLQLQDALERELPRHARSAKPMCVAYVDCDAFKSINDRFGHAEGDRVLRAIATTMSRQVRASDLVSRVGGDEFVILFPETHGKDLQDAIGKLQKALALTCAEHGWPVTFSIGVVTFVEPPGTPDAVMASADQTMYQAKAAGKDRVAWAIHDARRAQGGVHRSDAAKDAPIV
jgi:diguanylate cyclase (GGDEF)-like protein